MTIDHSLGKTFLFCSFYQLPSLCLGPLKDFLSLHGTLQGLAASTSTLLPKLKRFMETIRCWVLGADLPGYCPDKVSQTGMVRL